MPNPRDIFLQQFKPALDDKENRYPPFRAVLTTSAGATDTGDVWKDENARLVWFRAWGGAAPAWALCDVLEPTLGLGVYIKFNPDINQYEVLRDDPLMRSPDSDRTSYRAITNQDLLKGGRFQLWLDPTMFIPLSIYPTGADTVSVVSGDYILGGERLTFAGAVDQDISASRPAVGFHRFVGFYLDDTATLGTIDGNTVATGTDALEPAWPSGVLRVGVVDIDNATAISIDNIDNRKVIYTEDDETGALNVWPRADEVNINYTPYAAWALAVDALAASEQAIIGEGTFLSDDERIAVAAFVKGSGIDVSLLSTTTKDKVITLAKALIILEDFTISNTYSAVIYGDYFGAYIVEDASIDAFRVKFIVTGTGANINYGVYIFSGGHHRFAECIWDVRNGTANYALYMDATGLYSGAVVDLFDPEITGDVHNEDGTLNVYGGMIDGNVYAGNGATITFYNVPYITGTVTNHSSGTINGWYINADGALIGSSARSVVESTFSLDQRLINTYSDTAASHFHDYDASYPAGWTEVDAPGGGSDTNHIYSFWRIRNTSADASFDYNIQVDTDLEVDASGTTLRFVFGPFLTLDAGYTADVDYYFSMHADNAGIDADTFTRAHLQYDSGTPQWRVRGSVKDRTSGVQHDGAWVTLSTTAILPMPLWFMAEVRASDHRAWVGIQVNVHNDIIRLTNLLNAQDPDTSVDYNQPFARVHSTRGAGTTDIIWLGGLDIV